MTPEALYPLPAQDACPWQPDPGQMPDVVKLPLLKRFQPAEIVVIDESSLQLALLRMGVRIGDQIRLTHIAPLGDPIAISVNGTKIAIRKQDAARIWVKPIL